MMNNYVIYHLHSDLSNGVTNIDSTTKFQEYVDRAKSLGMNAMGLSEHGSVHNWLEKKESVETAGMKYIHAEEFYLCNALFKYNIDNQTQYFCSEDEVQEHVKYINQCEKEHIIKRVRENRHIVLIAKNYEGFKELNKLSSKAFDRNDGHFYFVPRITMNELENTSDNILCTSACLASPLRGDFNDRFLRFLIKNKKRCYLEIQHHNTEAQKEYNKTLLDLHNKYGIRLIAGTDTHNLDAEHAEARELLQHAKGVFFDGEKGFDLNFKTFDELCEAYRVQGVLSEDVYLSAIDETNKMADQIAPFEVDRSHKYPHLWENPEATFKQKINEGVKRRGIQKYPNYQEYLDRIKYEYSVYKHNGAIDFILLMDDVVQYCRDHDIKIGWGRGSVNGSVICWLLGITQMDSIKWNLNFERFMNTERVSLADIDTDIPPNRREEIINYLFHKHGLYCSDIITFNTIALKGAIRDVCRGMYKDDEKINYLDRANEICALADEDEEKARDKYPEVFRMVDLCMGTVVNLGTHACGRLIYDHPLDDLIGLCTVKDDERPVSQLWMHEIDSLALIKLDLLGLDTIELIADTCKAANISMLNPETMDIHDEKVWKSLRDDTTAIFQWESDTAQDYIKKLLSDKTIARFKAANGGVEPDKMELLTIGNSAIRPAGASYRDDLANGIVKKTGDKAIDDFLQPTFGYLVYQCQIIDFLHGYCGFTMGQADIVRRGFAKKSGTGDFIPIIKDGGYMPSDKKHEHYIDGFIATMKKKYGMNQKTAEKDIVAFLQVIEDASNYLFSRNHSLAYSFEGYACAWLRYYYPLEFLTTALNINIGKDEKTFALMDYAKRHKITISAPKYTYSDDQYAFDKDSNTIFKGVSSLKGIGEHTGHNLLDASANNYQSFIDFLIDNQKNKWAKKNEIKILIDIDYFDVFGSSKQLAEEYEIISKLATRKTLPKSEYDLSDLVDKTGDTVVTDLTKSGKHSDKQYTIVDSKALIKYFCSQVPTDEYPLGTKIKLRYNALGYLDVTDPTLEWRYCIVSKVNDKYTPKVDLYCLQNGKTTTFKVRKTKGHDFDIKTTWKDLPLKELDMIYIKGSKTVYKMKQNDDGKWVRTDEKEWLLTEYSVVT